jgi:hypothetical protein
MIDSNGYPTEETLQKIEAFDILKDDPITFTEYICENWVNGYPPAWNKETGCLQLSTGGWSGCESVISALRKTFFWMMYWEKSVRGGHYWFIVKRFEKVPITKVE